MHSLLLATDKNAIKQEFRPLVNTYLSTSKRQEEVRKLFMSWENELMLEDIIGCTLGQKKISQKKMVGDILQYLNEPKEVVNAQPIIIPVINNHCITELPSRMTSKLDEYMKMVIETSYLSPLDDYKDILLQNIIDDNKIIFRSQTQVKQILCRIAGEFWEIALGNADTFVKLGIGSDGGLDIISQERKIAIELKNRYNTCNSSSLKSTKDKLSSYKQKHPEYNCVLGIISGNKGRNIIKCENHNNEFIFTYIGNDLFELIFGSGWKCYVDLIIKYFNSFIPKLKEKLVLS